MELRYVYTKTYFEYGKITLTVNQLLKKMNIKPYELSKLTGIRYDVIKNYVSGNLYRIDLDVIARICFSLRCDINEVLKYEFVNSNKIVSKKNALVSSNE